ncbi:MAG: amidase [Armatimonadota bacterium]|nr:amidase [Armatimonadota bacterium]MDR7486973.1 amidase [Armatimonadota bacterium]MDR7536149.1 amidase [Armatimonadota bacterium]
MRSHDLDRLTLADLARAIRRRQVSPVEVTEACVERIERVDPALNAFVTRTPERALADARRAEQEIAQGRWRGPLHGVPIALKDLFATAGIRTTCGSRVLRDWVPAADATVVQRLADAGAVLLGKLNMSEFAYGDIHPEFGAPRNPWNLERFTGGSSSGSAAAVAAGLCFGSLGTDTGGSIRGPAAHCAIVGLKPTYGLVSRAGVIPLSWSLDHVGPMARTAEDAAILLDAIAGVDPADPTSATGPAPIRRRSLRALVQEVRTLRVGVLAAFLDGGTAPDVAARVRDAIAVLRPLVGAVEEVALPHADEIIPAWWTICLAEASAYHQLTLARQPEDYSEPVRERLLAGLAIPAVQYLQAQRVRRVIVQACAALFRRVDLLVLPTAPKEAPTISAVMSGGPWDVLRERIRATAPFNLTGLPAVSVPCGFTASGLPVGLQIVGARFADRMVLAAAHAFERAAGWWTRRPPVEAGERLPRAATR